jgi:ribosomal protein S7
MVSSAATTVDEYLAELSEESRAEIETVRDVILENLPDGYVETMRWGMITYEVPLDTYPETYNGKPLMFLALAAQKRHLALYLTNVAFAPGGEDRFRERYLATGKKLDMGRSCLRFKKADDIAIDLVAETIRATPLDEFIEGYEAGKVTT